jgi:hypothetical protein
MTEPDIRHADFSSDNPAVVSPDEYQDYFGFGDTKMFTLPDGKQQIFFKVMNEGERAQFQKSTSTDIKFNRSSGDAAIKADQAKERHELILTSVVGWSMKRRNASGGWEDVPFSGNSPGSTLGQWLKVADPKIVDELEFAIRKSNPWMQAEMTVEEIDKEIARLGELREQALEREKGK